MDELTLEKQTKIGRRGRGVKRVQEWLTFQGFGVKPDGEFGAATEVALRRFQKKRGLERQASWIPRRSSSSRLR